MSPQLTTRIIRLSEVTDDDAARWKALAGVAVEPNAYVDPRFLVPTGRLRAEAAAMHVLFVERGTELVGVFQFTIEQLWDRPGVWAVSTGGEFMNGYTERQHPLVAPDEPERVLAAVFARLRDSEELPGLVQLTFVPEDGPLADALRATIRFERLGVATVRSRLSAFARRPAEATGLPAEPVLDAYWLSAARRKQIRRRGRGLESAGGGRLHMADREADPGALDEFLDFQAEGWKSDPTKDGGAFRLDPVAEEWFREVVEGFRKDGNLIVASLCSGDLTLFTGISLVSGGAAFGFIDAYDETYARHSPGSLGRLAEWQHILRTKDVRFFDPALDPSAAESARMYADRREHVDLLVSVRGRKAWLVVHAVRAAAFARAVGDRARRLAGLRIGPHSAPAAPDDRPA